MPADGHGPVAAELDLQSPRRIHIVGIGGAGMSAIAVVLRAMGHTVSGSDLKDSPVAARLRSLGIAVAVGHTADNVGRIDALTYSPAVALTNPEIVRATELGALVIPRSGALAAICATRQCLAVAGTHGKTTTASMLSLILVEAGMRPSFVIGAVVSADDADAALIGRAHGARSVGTSAGATFTMSDVVERRSSVAFTLHGPDGVDGPLTIGVPGLHNARNAAMAAVAAMAVGAPFEAAAAALARFAGVTRRFEFRGEAAGVTFVDDYAHLPTEVRAALATARAGAWSRVVTVFQPHRYTRTAALADQFGSAFEQTDALVVTDVYSAGEPAVPGVSGQLIVDAVRAQDTRLPVVYAPGWEELRQTVAGMLRPGDLCLTLGAGDLTRLPDELLDSPSW
jgi:UDP-N-acetylmuramate--alanine ligase